MTELISSMFEDDEQFCQDYHMHKEAVYFEIILLPY